jgi:hypothetical protein
MDSEIPQQSIRMERSSSDGKRPMSYRSLRYWEDEECIWVDVTKTESPYEVAVHAHDLIRESPFFPKLKSCSVEPAGVLKLILQAHLPPLTYIKTSPNTGRLWNERAGLGPFVSRCSGSASHFACCWVRAFRCVLWEYWL